MDGWDGWAIENGRGEARNFTGAKAKAKVLWRRGGQGRFGKLGANLKSQTQRLDELNMENKQPRRANMQMLSPIELIFYSLSFFWVSFGINLLPWFGHCPSYIALF